MSDIFVSYDDLDRDRVRKLVATLEAHGWSVWWDHRITTGDAFSLVIERELEAASCVIAAWTDTSVNSAWVRAEASEGWKRGKLVPVLLDRVTPPMPFRQIQAADLVDWEDEGHPGFAKLVADLRERIGHGAVKAETATPVAWHRRPLTVVSATSALLLAAALAYSIASSRPGTNVADARTAATDAELSLPAAGGLLDPSASDAAADDDALAVAAALEGHWQAQVKYPDGATFEERFTFDAAGGRLSGTASMRGYGNRRGLLNGAIDGQRLSFRTTGRVQLDLFTVRDVSYLYEGLLEGDSIRFAVVEEGSGDPGFGFTSRRMTAEEAARIATGGIRPRLGGMTTNGLYRPDHVRAVMASRQAAMNACYEAAEYLPVNHEFVSYHVTLGAGGGLERLQMVPNVPSLERCMREVLAATEWGRTDIGQGGTMQLSVDARLPWNP